MTPPEIQDERELNKISLETYFFQFKLDSFSHSVDNLVTELENEFDKSYQLYLEGKHIQNNKIHNWFFSHDSLSEKLLAITEMKIVYRFRNLEIDIKKLIKAAYQIEGRELYRWEKIRDFLKTKKIIISEVDCYDEVNELRVMNNIIKHATSFEKGKISIQEFKNLKSLRHFELLEFYNRVGMCCDKFLLSLSQKIYDELYEFNEKRMEEMAIELALRMSKEQAEKFIKKLSCKY